MAILQKKESTGGPWIDKKSLESGMRAKIVSEVEERDDSYEGKPRKRIVGNISVEGKEGAQFEFNRTSANAMIDAWGEDTKQWEGREGTLQVESSIINNKRALIVYFIPDGYKITENDDGFLVIVKEDDIPIID